MGRALACLETTSCSEIIQRVQQRMQCKSLLIGISEPQFLSDFQQHVEESGLGDSVVGDTELDDLVLAFACGLGSSVALQYFDSLCASEFASIARKLRLPPHAASEARQLLWHRLFVRDGSPPRILEYRGEGRLKHWFRVVATRFLLNEIRGRKREDHRMQSDHAELACATELDPEICLLELKSKEQFRAALQEAIGALSPEDRNALRCHHVQAMTIDQMATAFGVHRATAARRVAKAREELFNRTREILRRLTGANTDELNSVIRVAHVQSSMSVARLLGSE